MAEEPGRGQQRQVLQPRDLPDLLDVPGLRLRAVVDAEGVTVGEGPAAGYGIMEPVRQEHVRPDGAQHLPFSGQQLLRSRQNGGLGLLGDQLGGVRRNHCGEPALARREGRGGRNLLEAHLPSRPDHLKCAIADAPGDSAGDIRAARVRTSRAVNFVPRSQPFRCAARQALAHR